MKKIIFALFAPALLASVAHSQVVGTLYPFLSAVKAFSVTKSIFFTASSLQYLTRTYGAPTSSLTYTWATWTKRAGSNANGEGLYAPASVSVTNNWFFTWGGAIVGGTTNAPYLLQYGGGGVSVPCTNTITDTNWHHIVLAIDSTQGTASNRVHIYLDGVECTYGTTTYPSLNQNGDLNNSNAMQIAATPGPVNYSNSYFAQTYFVDGQQLTPSSFVTGGGAGTTHPKAYAGSFGAAGYYLSYCNPTSTTTLGQDDGLGAQCSAAGANSWTLNNMSTANSSTNVPN